MQSPISPISTWRPKALITPSSPAQSPMSPQGPLDETAIPFFFWNGKAWMSSFNEHVHFAFGNRVDTSSGAASPTSRRRTLSEPHRFTVITQNCWFSEFFQEERAAGLLHLLKQRSADFVCLQEVTSALLEVLLADEWVRANYVVSDYSLRTLASYGTVILCRPDPEHLRLYKLPSTMGRKLLVAEYNIDQHKLVVATIHLESMSHSVKPRQKQLNIIFNVLNAYFNPQASLSTGGGGSSGHSPRSNASGSPMVRSAWGPPTTTTSHAMMSPAVGGGEMLSPSSRPPRHSIKSHRTRYSWAAVVESTREVKGWCDNHTVSEHPAGPSSPRSPLASPKSGANGKARPPTGAASTTASSSTPITPGAAPTKPMAILVSSVSGNVTHSTPQSPIGRPEGLAPLQASVSTDFSSTATTASPSPVSSLPSPTSPHFDGHLSKSASLDALRRFPSDMSVASSMAAGPTLQFPSRYQHSPSRSPAQGEGHNALFSPLRSRVPPDTRALQTSFSWSSDYQRSSQRPSRSETTEPSSAHPNQPASNGSTNSPKRPPTFAELLSGQAWSATPRAPRPLPSSSSSLSSSLSAMNESDDSATPSSSNPTSPDSKRGKFSVPAPPNSESSESSHPHLMIRSPSSFPLSPVAQTHLSISSSQHSLAPSQFAEARDAKVTVLLCGDFNMCHRSHENEAIETSGFTDVWPFLRPNEPGWTENTDVNLMRVEKKKSRKMVRYDRMLLRSEVVLSQHNATSPSGSVTFASSQAPYATPMSQAPSLSSPHHALSPKSSALAVPVMSTELSSSSSAASLGPSRPCVPAAIELLGTAPITPSCFRDAKAARDNIWLSDHFGLCATFLLD